MLDSIDSTAFNFEQGQRARNFEVFALAVREIGGELASLILQPGAFERFPAAPADVFGMAAATE